ncbi:MAG: DUF6371 domain-containing protein [Bacteroidales bacterium]|nr:DUF6371 domain-containing protein [Bacteroidales bacterium]
MDFYKKDRYRVAPQCPCGKSNKDGKFVPFLIDGTPSPRYGFCHSCGIGFYPNENNLSRGFQPVKESKKTDFKIVPYAEVKKTLGNYDNNSFVVWLKSKLPDSYESAIKRYRVGTSFNNRTIFWYLSIKEEVITGKSISYNASIGKRIKETPIYTLYTREKGYSNCLFGEHLLKDEYHKKVVLVESEKTAIVGSLVYPKLTWMATSGASGLTFEKAQVLKYREIIYIPDCDEAGRNSIPRVSSILKSMHAKIKILDYFLNKYNDGEDIADLLLTDDNII